jgi:4-diphosphocytidyl-2-C-methyl-D-erythritol kinase
MRVRAFAKINLSLRVLGRRPDRFHELRTIFQSIALHDTLTIRRSRGPFRLTCDDPNCPPDHANLIWRAAAAMWKAAGRRGAPRDVAVDLQKRIPMNAGLGGGSSDAAAAIRAFARLWRVDERRWRAIGGALGADVPYFFEGGTVLGLERGDLLFPLRDRPPASVVLVLPSFGVSTAEAFSWFDRDRRGAAGTKRAAAAHLFANDLEAAVAKRHPEITRIVRALERAGASHAAMTGSGSAVFGLVESARTAGRAARAVTSHAALSRANLSRAREAHVTTTLDRSRYHRLAGP